MLLGIADITEIEVTEINPQIYTRVYFSSNSLGYTVAVKIQD